VVLIYAHECGASQHSVRRWFEFGTSLSKENPAHVSWYELWPPRRTQAANAAIAMLARAAVPWL